MEYFATETFKLADNAAGDNIKSVNPANFSLQYAKLRNCEQVSALHGLSSQDADSTLNNQNYVN